MSKVPDTVPPTPAAGVAFEPAAGPVRRGRRRRRVRLYGPLDPRIYFSVAVAAFAVMLAAWWLAAALNVTSDLFLPSPGQVWSRGLELARNGTLGSATWASFRRISIGFLISTAFGLPIGILIGTYRIAEAAIEPPVDFIRYMPAVAFVPVS